MFSVWAEEWGFSGCAMLLILFHFGRSRPEGGGAGQKTGYGLAGRGRRLLICGRFSSILDGDRFVAGSGNHSSLVSYGRFLLITLCYAIGLIEIEQRRYTFHTG